MMLLRSSNNIGGCSSPSGGGIVEPGGGGGVVAAAALVLPKNTTTTNSITPPTTTILPLTPAIPPSSTKASVGIINSTESSSLRRFTAAWVRKNSTHCTSSNNNNVVTVLDWDDTLLPSTWVAGRHDLTSAASLEDSLTRATPEETAALAAVGRSASALLETCSRIGRVAIVTNAGEGWVELSASLLLPDVQETITRLQIPVLSARAAFESETLSHPAEWKYRTFQCVLAAVRSGYYYGCCSNNAWDSRHIWSSILSKPLFVAKATPGKDLLMDCCYNQINQTKQRVNSSSNMTPITLISIGDSDSERVAAVKCKEGRQAAFFRSCKLCERPSLTLLRSELDLITSMMPRLANCTGDLDLKVKFHLV